MGLRLIPYQLPDEMSPFRCAFSGCICNVTVYRLRVYFILLLIYAAFERNKSMMMIMMVMMFELRPTNISYQQILNSPLPGGVERS